MHWDWCMWAEPVVEAGLHTSSAAYRHQVLVFWVSVLVCSALLSAISHTYAPDQTRLGSSQLPLLPILRPTSHKSM